MSLLSACHVSQSNALIHPAYLSSICLHYSHTGIIGFPLCFQNGTFISESYTARGSALSHSLHLKCTGRQAVHCRLHTSHIRADLKSSPHNVKQKPLLSSTRRSYQERRGVEETRGEATCAARQRLPQIRLSYIVV